MQKDSIKFKLKEIFLSMNLEFRKFTALKTKGFEDAPF